MDESELRFLEKSMKKNPKSAKERTRKRTAIAALNQGFPCISPKAIPPSAARSPMAPYASAMPSPYSAPRAADLPMTMRLMGIIGSTQGVRFMQSPPKTTSSATIHHDLPANGEADASPRFSRKAMNFSASMMPCSMREDGATDSPCAGADGTASSSSTFTASSGSMMHIVSVQSVFCPLTSWTSPSIRSPSTM